MRQHRTVILPSFATIFLCSLLLTASFVIFGGVVRVLSMEKNLYAVEAFLPESLEADSLRVIQDRLEHTKHVDSVVFVSADSALADFRRHFSGEMLDLVEGNPIPPFFRVTLDENSKDPATLAELRNALAREDYFEEVQAPVEWVEKIAAWKFRMVFWPICISVLLLFILSLIICNSVRLSLFSRRLLVENMKYAGGSHFFIEFPFVMQGVVQGPFGGRCVSDRGGESRGVRPCACRRCFVGDRVVGVFQFPYRARFPFGQAWRTGITCASFS